MKPVFFLSPGLYAQMLDELNNLFLTDKPGYAADMNFFRDDLWLSDTAVIDHLYRRKGTWEVTLLFAHYKTPMKFISRRIAANSCPKRAGIMAFYMRRLAAKDQRGTLKLDIADMHLSLN